VPSDSDVIVQPSELAMPLTNAVRIIKQLQASSDPTHSQPPGTTLPMMSLKRAVESENVRVVQSNRLLGNIMTFFPGSVSERVVMNLNQLVRHDIDILLMDHSNFSPRKFFVLHVL
jgi:hypothetical protein